MHAFVSRFAFLTGALAVLVLLLAFGSPRSVSAADIGVIAIDVDTTGNIATPCDANGDANLDYPCNNSTVLGAIDTCVSLAVGASTTIDVVGVAIPAGGTNGSDMSFQGAGQSDMALDWTPNGVGTSPIQVTAFNKTVALVHQGLGDNPAGAFSATGGVASTDGHWEWSDVDVNPNLVGEGGQGIAIRLTVKGLLAGTASLSIATNFLSQATWTDIHGNEYSVGQYDGATIVVGGNCPAATPTATSSSAPTPTSSSAPATTVAGSSATPASSSAPTPCGGCTPTSSPCPPPPSTACPIGGIVELPVVAAGERSADTGGSLGLGRVAAIVAAVIATIAIPAGIWYRGRR